MQKEELRVLAGRLIEVATAMESNVDELSREDLVQEIGDVPFSESVGLV